MVKKLKKKHVRPTDVFKRSHYATEREWYAACCKQYPWDTEESYLNRRERVEKRVAASSKDRNKKKTAPRLEKAKPADPMTMAAMEWFANYNKANNTKLAPRFPHKPRPILCSYTFFAHTNDVKDGEKAGHTAIVQPISFDLSPLAIMDKRVLRTSYDETYQFTKLTVNALLGDTILKKVADKQRRQRLAMAKAGITEVAATLERNAHVSSSPGISAQAA